MATVLNTLYPPLIETFMPAFPYEGPAVVNFSISSYNEQNSFKKIHISLSKQKTNNSVLKNTTDAESSFKVFNNIWILNVGDSTYVKTQDGINYTVEIPSSILNTDTSEFVIDDYYKVQIRLDNSPLTPVNANYLSSQRPWFSEWSSVCLIKAIPKISLEMSDFQKVEILESQSIDQKLVRTVQKGIIPIVGRLQYETSKKNISDTDTQSTTAYDETLQKYKITISSQRTGDVIDETKWVLTSTNQNPNQIYWLADLTNATAEEVYYVDVEYYTKNQYYDSQRFLLQIASYDSTPFNPTFTFEKVSLDDNSESGGVKEKLTTEEDGFVTLTINSNGLPPGYVYVKRASSLDNFKKWELLSCTRNTGRINRTIVDKTVGSLVRYRYSVQYYVKSSGQWTETKFSKIYDLESNFYDVYPDFYDILISRGDKQLAIRYNNQITSYNQVINRQVINTLGSKYPKFAENAQMNYKKITISGLLTAESDFNRTFLNEQDYAYDMDAYDKEMNGVYSVRNDTLADGERAYVNVSPLKSPTTYNLTNNLAESTNHDLYPKDNWWWERKFRDAALEWLNDGEPKLFRSMTEGNMAVMLTDITLSPNAQLGRRIYNISMTAYEIGDGYSLDTLSSLGIVDIPNEYEEDLAAKGMGINDSDEDDSDDGTIVVSCVGQLYNRSGKNLDTNKLTCVSDDDKAIYINNKSTDVFTINDFYKYILYQGTLRDFAPVEDSYILTDVRIQFTSKPLWFNLNKKDGMQESIELITFNGDQEDERDEKASTIIGGYNTYTSKSESLGLGYKLGIKFENPENSIAEQIIFVGEKGYYQIPSNIKVKEITLYEDAEATIDYKLNYKIKYDESLLAKEASITKPFVGQISGRWEADTAILPLISKKYEYQKKTRDLSGKLTTGGKDGLAEIHYLDNLTAFGFDGTSYAVLNIKFKDQEEYNRYVVGRTGVYNLMTNYPIDDIEILGRRLFRKENPSYSYSRYGTTYIFDPSTYMYQYLTNDILKWENLDDSLEEKPVLIIYNDALDVNSDFAIIENKVRQLSSVQTGIDTIIGNYEDETTQPYASVQDIPNPVQNTVYGIYNDEDEIVLKLYNANGVWEEVSAGYNEETNSYILDISGDTRLIETKRKVFGLYDWEYDFDKSADPSYQENMLVWYNTLLGETNIPVVLKTGPTGSTLASNHIFKIGEKENIPFLNGYESTKDIKNPQYNVVYAINKTNKIYYINDRWYDVEKYASNDNLTILAKVPVDGMLNYRGRIISLIYDNSVVAIPGGDG